MHGIGPHKQRLWGLCGEKYEKSVILWLTGIVPWDNRVFFCGLLGEKQPGDKRNQRKPGESR
jgi:hypothetical protein